MNNPSIIKELLEHGFKPVHWNPKPDGTGGWMEYYIVIDDLPDARVKVTIGDYYSRGCDFMVWLQVADDSIAMRHIRTMTQLEQFYLLVAGKSIEQEGSYAEL